MIMNISDIYAGHNHLFFAESGITNCLRAHVSRQLFEPSVIRVITPVTFVKVLTVSVYRLLMQTWP